jgi:leucyl aminopeptidase
MVKVRSVRGGVGAAGAGVLVVPVVESGAARAVRALGARLAGGLGRRLRGASFRGRVDESLVHHGDRTIVLVGLGPDPAVEAWRRAGGRVRQESERQRARRVVLLVPAGTPGDALAAAVEGFQLAGYRFTRYSSDPERGARVESLVLVGPDVPRPGDVSAALAPVDAVVTEVFRARDLVNEPASVKNPRFLAEQLKALAAELPGVTCEAWGPDRIRKEALAGLEAVARGSREEPRFLILRHAPRGARRKVAIVGKAITFDSGGLSLKPAKSMETMKYDMAGGAAALGAVAAAARLGLPVHVTAYVPATENLPGEAAQKPGDVIRFLNGKTVEVLNTDAEGRLVLADALAYASRARPDAIVDLATLTGACRVALGSLYAAVMGTDQPLIDALVAAGREAGECVWQLPLVREYRDDLKSPIADLKNVSSGGEAGAIIGGLFLQEFVDGVPWAHLDIAGPAFAEKDLTLAPRGGTGFGVRLLVRWLQGLTPGNEGSRTGS